MVADSKYAIQAAQALQRCNSNVVLVHTIRRIWRAVAAEREVDAAHIKGHSDDPWNEFSDVLADYVHLGGPLPREHSSLPQWYVALDELREAPNLALPCTAMPTLMPLCRSLKPLEAPRLRKNDLPPSTPSPSLRETPVGAAGLWSQLGRRNLPRPFWELGLTSLACMNAVFPAAISALWESTQQYTQAVLEVTTVAAFGSGLDLLTSVTWPSYTKTLRVCWSLFVLRPFP